MRRFSPGIALAVAVTFFGLLDVAGAADLLVSSRNTSQVLRFNGTTGVPLPNPVFVAAGSGGLSGPAGLAFGPGTQLHVAAAAGNAVLQYDGVSGDSIGSFATAGVANPAGMAFGRDGHLYVASRLDHRIVRYDGTTGALLGDVVTAESGSLSEPSGIAFGPDGHLYVSSFANDRVLRYDGVTGAFIGIFASNLQLDGPEGLAFGADGHLYVSSFNNNRVLRFNGTSGAFMNAFVAAGPNGPDGPMGLTFGLDGNLYVASFNSDRILRYNKATGASMGIFVAPGTSGLDGPTYLLWNPVKIVGPSPSDYTTIQAAVNALPAAGPRIIKVKEGTYREAVTISRKNATALLELQRIVLMADPDAAPGSVVVIPPAGRNTFTLELSRFVTLKGFRMTGATKEAIFMRGGGSTNRDVTLDSNDLHANGSASANGGIYIGRDNPRTWAFNNLIRANGRNGVLIDCGVENAPKYFVNNTIVQNGFNGLFVGDSLKDEIYLANNVIVGNGTSAGTTGGRFGVLRESTAPGTGPGTRTIIILRNNLFYGNTGGDIGNVIQTLDAGDGGNLTTTGAEELGCFGGAAGCPGAIAGCTFADCGAGHLLGEIFADPSNGNFRLAPGSPAIGAGQPTLFQAGLERVPSFDFEGDPRPDDLPSIGFDEP
jgi:hypothetical protein